MNSIVDEVEITECEFREYAANILAENMFSQLDHEGHNILLMKTPLTTIGMKSRRFQLKDKYLTTRSS
jgi:hypothetical protein